MSVTKESSGSTPEVDRKPKKPASNGSSAGFAEGIAEGLGELTTIAREQTTTSVQQGEQAVSLLRDQTLASIRQAQVLGMELLDTLANLTAPFLPKLPSVVPVASLEILTMSGFEVGQQVLAAQKALADRAIELLMLQSN